MESLSFDPIEEAVRQWRAHGWESAARGMAAVTSVMRAHQILLARVDEVLRPFHLTFARYEVLALLNFSSRGEMPLGRLGARLQVHPTSVTNAIDRLEDQGFVERRAHETDRRALVAAILPPGRTLVGEATLALNCKVFEDPGLSPGEADELVNVLRALRSSAGDFSSP